MKCYNCGADKGLHRSETNQCPRNGIEETRFDKITGKYYPQQWADTTFEEVSTRKMELAAPQMLAALEAVRRHGLIEKEGYGDVVKMLNDAINAAKL